MKKYILLIYFLTSFLFLSSVPTSNECNSVILVGKLAKVQCDINSDDDYVSTKGTGTITFYNTTNNTFATLGHGIKNKNDLLEIILYSEGNISNKEIETKLKETFEKKKI
mgnify:CR=1 FL=1